MSRNRGLSYLNEKKDHESLLESTLPAAPRLPVVRSLTPTRKCSKSESLKHRLGSVAVFVCLLLGAYCLCQTFFFNTPLPLRSFLSNPDRLPLSSSKNAYITFLPHHHPHGGEDLPFSNARILAYQLLHDPKTKSNDSIPFIIIVPSSYPDAKRQRLTNDGAMVIPVDGVSNHRATRFMHKGNFEHLRMFELYEFELLCYISPSTLITSNMDDVFEDDAVTTVPSLSYDGEHAGDPEEIMEEHRKASLPSSYVFAATGGLYHFSEELIVVKPGGAVFDYYAKLAVKSGNKRKGQQGLFGKAHGRSSRMPWRRLDDRFEAEADVGDAKVVSRDDGGGSKSSARKLWERKKEEMEQSLGNV